MATLSIHNAESITVKRSAHKRNGNGEDFYVITLEVIGKEYGGKAAHEVNIFSAEPLKIKNEKTSKKKEVV